MKFAIVVVLFALALGVQSSVLPLAGTVVVGPGSVAVQAAVHPVHPVVVGPGPVQVVAGPAVVPAVVAAAPVGTYIAKTRGAVHVAPLPGHLNSAASVNLEPAPGTW
uniref:Adult cuticle protein 1 n=1 Tax=Glossina brevipalpis TaxID=37001 RepID=A0A1A9W1T6_9MUSC